MVSVTVTLSGWLSIALLFCQQLIIFDTNVSPSLREHGVVLAAVHPRPFPTRLASLPAGYCDDSILSCYRSSLSAPTRLMLAAITPGKWALWSFASYALYGCLGRQWADSDPPTPNLSLNCILYTPVPFLTYIYYLAESGPPRTPAPSPASQLLSDGWRGRGINLGFMGTPLPLSTAVCDPSLPPWRSFLDCSLSVHACARVCTCVPFL